MISFHGNSNGSSKKADEIDEDCICFMACADVSTAIVSIAGAAYYSLVCPNLNDGSQGGSALSKFESGL